MKNSSVGSSSHRAPEGLRKAVRADGIADGYGLGDLPLDVRLSDILRWMMNEADGFGFYFTLDASDSDGRLRSRVSFSVYEGESQKHPVAFQ